MTLSEAAARVDAGFYADLPALLACLVEAGDARADGLRRLTPTDRGHEDLYHQPHPMRPGTACTYGWCRRSHGDHRLAALEGGVFDRLQGGTPECLTPSVGDGYPYVTYPTRSAALLALADALVRGCE